MQTLDGNPISKTKSALPELVDKRVGGRPQIHLVVVGRITEGAHFGEGLIGDNIHELAWAPGIGRGNSRFSVVSDTRVEVMLVPKVDLHRFTTDESWEYLQQKNKEIPLDHIHASYEKKLKWMDLKKSLAKERNRVLGR